MTTDTELADRRSDQRLADYAAWSLLLGGISATTTAMLLLIHRRLGAAVAVELDVPDGLRAWYGAGLAVLGAGIIYVSIATLLTRRR